VSRPEAKITTTATTNFTCLIGRAKLRPIDYEVYGEGGVLFKK